MTDIKYPSAKKKKHADQTSPSSIPDIPDSPADMTSEPKQEQPSPPETPTDTKTTDETIQISQTPPQTDQKQASADTATVTETVTVNVTTLADETPPQSTDNSNNTVSSEDKETPEKDNAFLTGSINIPLEKSSRKFMLIGIIAVVAIIVGIVSYIFFISKIRQEESQKEETTITESLEPTKETKPQLVRSEITFEVLNGSGVSGAAAKATDKLKSLGYTVIKVGNADTSNYKNTSLYISKDITKLSALILEDIHLEYKNATFSGDLKSSTASARLILGKD